MRLKVRWLAAHDQKSHHSMADEVHILGGALVLAWRTRAGAVRQFIVPPGSWWNASTEETGED